MMSKRLLVVYLNSNYIGGILCSDAIQPSMDEFFLQVLKIPFKVHYDSHDNTNGKWKINPKTIQRSDFGNWLKIVSDMDSMTIQFEPYYNMPHFPSERLSVGADGETLRSWLKPVLGENIENIYAPTFTPFVFVDDEYDLIKFNL